MAFEKILIMKKDIKITIKEGLSPSDEVVAIAQQLAKKTLPIARKGIGNGKDTVNISHTTSTITVERVSTEKPIQFCKCPVCESEYQSNIAVYYWTNYGGSTRKKPTCSLECAQAVVDALPGRTALKSRDLKRVFDR